MHPPPAPPALPSPPSPPLSEQCSVGTWGQCSASACCASLTDACFVKNEHYAQCRSTCPSGRGWECEHEALALSSEIATTGSSSTLPIGLGLAGVGLICIPLTGWLYKAKAHARLSSFAFGRWRLQAPVASSKVIVQMSTADKVVPATLVAPDECNLRCDAAEEAV